MLDRSIRCCGALLVLLLAPYHAANSSPLKADEHVWFFPSSANQLDEGTWQVPVHHWVFEKEEGSISRKFSQKVLSKLIEQFDVSKEVAQSDRFGQRLSWFLVDNERGKKLAITLSNKIHELEVTNPNGHAISEIQFNSIEKKGSWLKVDLEKQSKASKDFIGEVQLIPKTGLSVISDIDDTIKVSNVLDKKELIRNTFAEPYKVTAGMPAFYQQLKEQNAYFHYVSASPWQIYPSLKPFMDSHYPKGTVSLRYFRLKDSSLIDFLKPSIEYKYTQIKQIIQRYPKHQFVLIGDSGEHAPEVYARIYREFPDVVQSIYIRAVKDSNLSEERFNNDFEGISKSIWKVFEIPDEI